MRLNTDFYDYYDAWMDGNWMDTEPLYRRMRGGPPRRVQLAMCDAAGYRTINHMDLYKWRLMNKFLYDKYPTIDRDEDRFVVYVDEYGHAGEGKVLASANDILEMDGDLYATAYCSTDIGYSERWLFIGEESFCYTYNNHGKDWRANVDPDITMTDFKPKRRLKYPLYALDIVEGGVVDLNLACGLRHSPIPDLIKAKDVADLINDYYDKHRVNYQEIFIHD